MANLIPIQLDKDTGLQVASRSGLGLGNIPPGFFPLAGYLHEELIVSDTWVVAHGATLLNYQVQVFDSTGNLIIPDQVITIDADTIHIIHGAPITGKAIFTFLQDA